MIGHVEVTRADLERGLAALAGQVGDPRGGIHGPATAAWRLGGEGVNFLGAGRAVLLQLAHPPVAYAIAQHSSTRHDARARFRRTFDNVFSMVFGDLDSALRAARVVHAVHSRIRGTIDEDAGRYRRGARYAANESASLLWVHATLIDTIFAVRTQVGLPLPPPTREAYYQDSKRFALLFGIPEGEVPADTAAFAAYMERTVGSDFLAVTEPAREMARFVLAPPTAALAPVFAWYRVVTAGLLPARLRRAYGFRWTAADRALFASTTRAIGGGARLLPASLRLLPEYLAALRRLELAGDSRTSRAVARLVDTGLRLWS